MRWRKLGLVFSPSGQYSWMKSHAQLPVAYHLGDDVYRIYFASRDDSNRSYVAYADLDICSPHSILRVSSEPVLSPGSLGNFDDHGVFPACVLEHDRKLWMYIVGWNPGLRPPLFYSSIGLAVSKDQGKTFQRISPAPVMSRGEFDPCLVTSPFVLFDHGIWRMWYVSGFKWEELSGNLCSYYDIKYAESRNGVQWTRNGLVCVGLKAGQRNISRPCVIKEDTTYRMWYSFNEGEGYRIGYAESEDGYRWTRRDEEAGIDVSADGWDSGALAYPWVFLHDGKKYMLYNGNDFGRDGFGLAVEE